MSRKRGSRKSTLLASGRRLPTVSTGCREHVEPLRPASTIAASRTCRRRTHFRTAPRACAPRPPHPLSEVTPPEAGRPAGRGRGPDGSAAPATRLRRWGPGQQVKRRRRGRERPPRVSWFSMDPVAAHSCHLLQQLHEQRIQGLLCDCMLVVRGVCFKAHKNVLAAFSQYFRSLFQNSSSQKNDVFHLDVKNISGIGQILDFMYTSHLDLNPDNIQVMLDTAQCLQVQNVLDLCHTFLKSASEQPPGMPCNSTFSLQSTLAPDATCVMNENYPHLLQECPAGTQHAKVLDEPHPHAPSVSLHHSTGEMSKQAPSALDSSCSELPCKQPSYYYKLRDFYSKQYCKQTACPSQERGTEQPFAFTSPADLAAVDSQSCAISHSECLLESSEHLPSTFLAQLPSDSIPDPESDAPGQQPTKQMRLKKAIHLKKLNFLKSQISAEQASEHKVDYGLTKRTESTRENMAEEASSRSTEEKESEDISSENFNCVSEMELSEAPATLEDQSQSLHSQRQYACELCGKPFKHPSNLELHKRSHTGRQPADSLTQALW
ncbi:Hypothetical predicted protein [Marmota monax]|uniref:BTB domain-containing protein n=1 Tax=Marmota monax TaxID=9995 RepID=A0A5E4ATN5_MARMO|nr:Hypothetical predicted protein [Marmota monax]